jgi:hypothetical protein
VVRRLALFLAVLLAGVAAAQPRTRPLTRGLADTLYVKLAGSDTVLGTVTFTNITVTGTCTGCSAGSGTVTSVGNGTIGTLFTASWANATTTPALSLDITNQGTTTTVLHGNAAGHPAFGPVVSADMNITTTGCTNQFVTAISAGGVGTCTTDTLASAQHANQGTTTTVLHGAAAGNPSFGAVVSADLNITTTSCTNQFVTAISSGAVGTCTGLTLAAFPSMAANTALVNATSGSSVPTAFAMPSCSGAGSALSWTTNTGFGCNSSITAATNANLTGPITSSGNATSIASQTGTGTKFVMDTGPTVSNLTTTGTTTTAVLVTTANTAGAVATFTQQNNSGGAGVTIIPGTDSPSVHALQITNAANTVGRHIFYGTGDALLAQGGGVVSIGANVMTAGTMTATKVGIDGVAIQRYDWTNAMVTALGAVTTGDITVCTLPAKTVVLNAYVVIDTADTSANALTVALGRVSATYIDYVVASDAKAAANTVYGDASGERGTNLTGYDLPSITGTTAVKAHFVKTTTNLSTVTASTGHIYLVTETLP